MSEPIDTAALAVDMQNWLAKDVTEQRRQRIASARNISTGQRTRIFERDGFRCRRCGATPRDGARLVVDHVVPVALGGTRDDENLQTLCDPCNGGKAARPPHPHDLATPDPEGGARPVTEWPIGLWVLTGEPRCWQGQVRAIARNGSLVIELFSWLDGRKTYERLVAFADAEAEAWQFFDDENEWRDSAERQQAKLIADARTESHVEAR